jgi:hypothetical protein
MRLWKRLRKWFQDRQAAKEQAKRDRERWLKVITGDDDDHGLDRPVNLGRDG